ncbi:putative polysaccharide export protein [Botrytis fragariae]|uniref:Putative polysaccharide export protein n=1 Tax=Botrytis fragariae TaxID=1964551 RepID=A0A8H6AVV1_9HELO|nr:putative polysaccharide export protein [Botrytis fragariae]KAF5874474.1 putative polysaccharide export protein [Botrytis fragariae]
MTFLPKRYLRAPRSPLHPHSRLPNLVLALLVFFLFDAYWIIIQLPNPIHTITPPFSAIHPSDLTSNQHAPPSLQGQDSLSVKRVGGEGDQESLLFGDVESRQASQGSKPPMGNPNNETIFIAAIFRKSEIMLRQNWSPALVSLAHHLGPQNVYVSIIESGSWDGTKAALVDLDGMLGEAGVERTIELGMDRLAQLEELKHVPEEGQDRTGWLHTGRKESESGWEMRRIPYLARLRNRAMEPLLRVWDEGRGRKFDKILWINDVVFTTTDVTTLLATNNNFYAAACSLDFSLPSQYYDTFALRDSSGRKTSSLSWPYFYAPQSLNALKRNDPVPVKSCWNGMVVFDGEPWYPSSSISLNSKKEFKGLRFRGVPDSLAEKHVEGSECCLIHADNPSREKKGIYVNPNVRVGYKREVYEMVNGKGGWPGRWEAVRGVWGVRMGWVREWGSGWVERGRVGRRVQKWTKEGEGKELREELGLECLINEMQVLYQSGWRHL